VAYRITNNWNVNGSLELGYFDNAFTSISPRQFKQYKFRTAYKPRPWATISGAFNDRERHNTPNNNLDAVAAGESAYFGPINHIDYSRIASVGAMLAPNEHFGLDVNYGYTEVYTATNICFTSGATANTTRRSHIDRQWLAECLPRRLRQGLNHATGGLLCERLS